MRLARSAAAQLRAQTQEAQREEGNRARLRDVAGVLQIAGRLIVICDVGEVVLVECEEGLGFARSQDKPFQAA